MADIRINQLPAATGPGAPVSSDVLAIDGATTRKATIQQVVDVGVPVASQAEAQTGTNNEKRMTPLTTKQSIASEVGVTLASAAQGSLADSAVQLGDNVLVPPGGVTGQILSKTSNADNAVAWNNAPGDMLKNIYDPSNIQSNVYNFSQRGPIPFSRRIQDRIQDDIHATDFALGVSINDGVSRPLSTIFATLAEAQSVYPHATSLTDELAWAAAQAAVSVAEANTYGGSLSYGGEVILPRGTLNFGTNTLRVKNDYVSISGAPYQGTRINRSSTTGYAIHFAKDTVANLFYVGLRNVQINSTVAMSAGGLVFFDIANFSIIRDCRLVNGFINLYCRSVHDFHVENVNGVHGAPYAVGNSTFANLFFDTQTAAGTYNPNNNGWVSNCNFRSFTTDAGYTTHGVYITSADGIWFDHCHIGNSETSNLTIIPKNGTTQLSGVTMSNCWFDQGGNGRMVNIAGATSATFGYFQWDACYLTGGTTCTDGFRIDPTAGTVIRHVEINGGKIMNLKGHGIIANRLEGLVMSGVQIRNVGTAGGGATGMTFAGNCKNLTITGVGAGYAGDLSTPSASTYGLVISSGITDYVVTGCNFKGNSTAGLLDSGGAVSKVVANNLV